MSSEPRARPPGEISPGLSPGHQVILLVAEYGRALTEQIAAGLGSAQLASNTPALILCHLAGRGVLRPRDLLGPTHLNSAAMTKHLDMLESAGLIERTYGAIQGDRRATLVRLTTDGERAARLLAETVEREFEQVVRLRDRLTQIIGDA